jgi:hypothetical protein
VPINAATQKFKAAAQIAAAKSLWPKASWYRVAPPLPPTKRAEAHGH